MSEQAKCEQAKCELCGEPMPPNEEMFKFHGYSGPCPKPPLPKQKTGIELIADERQRQIRVEGWTAEHDAGHTNRELAQAAACYLRAYATQNNVCPDDWPWEEKWWKPGEIHRGDFDITTVIKAGALAAAELDRKLRPDESSK